MAALKALAFGPLPAGQARAAEAVGQDTASGTAVRGLPGGGGGGGGAVDLNAPEPMMPRASDRLAALASGSGGGGGSTFGELGGVGNIEDLPGAQPSGQPQVNFLSSLAGWLSGRTGGDTGDQENAPAASGPGETPDFAKAIQAFNAAVKAAKAGSTLAKGSGGGWTLSSAPGSVQGLGENAAATGYAPLTAKGLDQALGPSAGSSSSGLGAASAGAAGLSAILSLLAAGTGDQGVAKASQAVGLGPGALGVVGGGGGLGGVIGALPSLLGLFGNTHMDRGDLAFLQSAAQAEQIASLAAAATATGAVPYAAIAAQAINDAMGLANYLQGNQNLAQTALGSIPVVGSYATALYDQLNKPSAGYLRNKIAGSAGPKITGGLEQLAGQLDGVDLSQLSGAQIGSLVTALGSGLGAYYNPNTEMGAYLTGLREQMPAEYGTVTATRDTAQQNLLRSIALMQQQGASPADIGRLVDPAVVWDMANSDWVGVPGGAPNMGAVRQGLEGYQPAMSQEQAANFYGGPTWAALYGMYGPGTADIAKQYGITLPGLNYSALTPVAPTGGPAAPPDFNALYSQYVNAGYNTQDAAALASGRLGQALLYPGAGGG